MPHDRCVTDGLRDRRMEYLTAMEIAVLYRKPLGTVYRLACTEQWQRTGRRHRPVMYAAEDVDKTFARLT